MENLYVAERSIKDNKLLQTRSAVQHISKNVFILTEILT